MPGGHFAPSSNQKDSTPRHIAAPQPQCGRAVSCSGAKPQRNTLQRSRNQRGAERRKGAHRRVPNQENLTQRRKDAKAQRFGT